MATFCRSIFYIKSGTKFSLTPPYLHTTRHNAQGNLNESGALSKDLQLSDCLFLKKAVLVFVMLLAVVVISFTCHAADNDTKITMMTEVYPPYNMQVDGRLEGISVDILEGILKILETGQTRDDVILTNWSRAYSMAVKKKNHMVFSTTRTALRDSLFKWVGPIIKTTISVIAPKEKAIVINTLSDLNQYRIGTVLKDVGEQILFASGIDKKQIHSIGGKNAIDLSFKKMENNRIDMFAYEVNVARYEAKRKGYNMADFEVVYTLKEGELYYAFNRGTDDEIIAQWQSALDTLKANGFYNKILDKYKD